MKILNGIITISLLTAAALTAQAAAMMSMTNRNALEGRSPRTFERQRRARRGIGLSDDEIAFYDALAENQSAREVMGEPTLRVITHELVTSIKNSVSVGWMHREATRACMRVLVKRLLRKYGYPPDLQDAAVRNVLQQAEALSAAWAA
jgi:type I restriction enzyme, R subunit